MGITSLSDSEDESITRSRRKSLKLIDSGADSGGEAAAASSPPSPVVVTSKKSGLPASVDAMTPVPEDNSIRGGMREPDLFRLSLSLRQEGDGRGPRGC